MSYEHGRVLAVNETRLGSELVADHAAGVTSLTVEDPVDFDEDGGWLKVGDQVIEYTTFDDDTGEITLVGTLATAAVEGDRVYVWDRLFQAVTTDKVAEVALDGDDDNTDPLEATVASHLVDRLAEGIRGETGESVLLELDGDEWRVVDVLGLADSTAGGTVLPAEDAHVVVAPGDQSITLTYEPISPSEHVYWNGLYQPSTEWSRAGRVITVPDPSGMLVAGDRFDVEYLYKPGQAAIEDQPGAYEVTQPTRLSPMLVTASDSTSIHSNGLGVQDFNIPAGSFSPGDLLLLTIAIGTYQGGGYIRNVDPRFTKLGGSFADPESRFEVWYAYAGAWAGSELTVLFEAGSAGNWNGNKQVGVTLSVIGGKTLDPTRLKISAPKFIGTTSDQTHNVPAVPGVGGGAVAFSLGQGTIGGSHAHIPDPWQRRGYEGVYIRTSIATLFQEPIAEQPGGLTSEAWSVKDEAWVYLVCGFAPDEGGA